MGVKNNKATISFSEIGDAELLELLNSVNYNFAGFCKDLMKDGMKYRGLIKTEEIPKSIPKLTSESRPFQLSEEIKKKKQETQQMDREELKKLVADKLDRF